MKQLFAQTTKKLKTIFKKATALTMAAGLLTGITLAVVPKAAAASSTATGQVSLTFDDGLESAYSNVAPILATYGLSATEYVPTGCIGTGVVCESNDASNVMTWAQIQALQNTYGWEVGSHTATTPCLANDCAGVPTETAAQIDAELADSQQTLINEGIKNPVAFAFPYGDYNNAGLAEVDKYYTNARGFQDVGYNVFPYNGTLLVDQQVQGPVTVAQVESYIATAKANNEWLVLSFHDVVPNPSTVTADYQWGTTELDQVAAYLKAQNMPVVTASGGFPTSSTNLLANGCFTSGIADGWTTDNATNIKADQQAASTTSGGSFSAINGHGDYCNGTAQNALDSVSLSNNSSTTDSHLYSPTVNVTPGTTYIMNNFVNVTSTAGEVDLIVDEFNAAGTWISDQFHTGFVGGPVANNAIQVGGVNFTYTPSSASVASARLQVVAHGSGLTGYFDNAQMYPESAVGSTGTSGTGGNSGGKGGGGATSGNPGITSSYALATAQRSTGETDTVAVGPNNELDYYFNAQGSSTWNKLQIAGAGSAFSTPAMIQRSNGETDIVVEGPNNTLTYYYNAQGSPNWGRMQAAPAGLAASAATIVQRSSNGETDIAVQGPNNDLEYYFNAQGSSTWNRLQVAPVGSAASAPVMVQRSNGETDIAVAGPNDTLTYYYNAQGSPNWGSMQAAPAESVFGTPAIIQRSNGETDIAVQDPFNGLAYYFNAQGSSSWGKLQVAGSGSAFTAPTMVQRSPSGETDIAVTGPNGSLAYYFNAQGSPKWGLLTVAGSGSASQAPVMVQRSTGETDIQVVSSSDLLYYYNAQGSPNWGVLPIAGN